MKFSPRAPVILLLLAAAALALPACTASDADRRALAQGFSDYQARRFDEAENAAAAYLAKYPTGQNADEALYLRGLARLAKSDTGGAAQDLTRAIQQSHRADLIAKSWRALADIAFDATRYADAAADYQKSLDAKGLSSADAGYVDYRLGESLQNQGDWDRARPLLEKAAAAADPTIAQRARDRAAARYFTLQFGAFRDTANAAGLVRDLKSAALSAGIFPESHDGQTIYAVRAGGYATWAAADQAREKLLAKYPLVTVYP
ncbi:MAG TPA: SPOR domain-containing protein [Phycisphaerae bacterium]|nr:SPOR domain-containing protein [Phycisphaerae bacterium]